MFRGVYIMLLHPVNITLLFTTKQNKRFKKTFRHKKINTIYKIFSGGASWTKM